MKFFFIPKHTYHIKFFKNITCGTFREYNMQNIYSFLDVNEMSYTLIAYKRKFIVLSSICI